jgi:spermidine/putrescine transport system permease protein
VLAFLYAPVLVLVLYSFNDARFSAVWQGFTLGWYQRLLQSPETAAALKSTLVVSLTATALATVLGTLLALGLHLRRFRGRDAVELLLYLPVVAPDIVMGVALLAFYVAVHLPLGRLSIILAHGLVPDPFVALIVRARLQDFPAEVIEAARDLGADEGAMIRHVLLPIIRPGVLAERSSRSRSRWTTS